MTANNDTTRTAPYLAAVVGRNAEGSPYAFHLEGFAASADPRFFAAEDDKRARFQFSIGIRPKADELMARAAGDYDKDKEYTMSSFVTLSVFGDQAEALSKSYVKGMKVAVSGKLEMRDFQRSDGTPGKDLTCAVNKLVVIETRTKAVKAELSDSVGTTPYVYTDKTGTERVIPMAELLTGHVVGEPAFREKDGKKVLSFGLKTKLPASKVYDLVSGLRGGDRKHDPNKKIMNVVVFDRKAEALVRILRPGTMMAVTGPVDEEEYNGATNYRLRARETSIMKFAPLPVGASAPGTAAAPASDALAGTAAAAAQAHDSYDAAPQSDFVELDDEDAELPF